MFKSIKRYLKSTSGNTLAEFAVTTKKGTIGEMRWQHLLLLLKT